MTTTDYNKTKKISPTTQNDSGATIDKAQPLVLNSSSSTIKNTLDASSDVNSSFFNGFSWNDDGTKMYVFDDEGNLSQYNLSTPYDISTSSFIDSSIYSSQEDLAFNNDGSKVYTVDRDFSRILENNLSTNYDTSTDSFVQELGTNNEDDTPVSIDWNDDGTKLYMLGDSTDNIYEYSLSTAFDISTASLNQSFDLSPTVGSSPRGIVFNTDGSSMYVNSSDEVFIFNLSTAFDISTASLNQSFGISGTTNDIDLNEDESVLYAVDESKNIKSYNIDLDDSKTGTGDIVLDWSNISSESDIAVYDQNGNLLPYEIESFDPDNETAVLWCWNSWVRDDTVQAQIVYGDGPTSSEENVTGTWNNTGQNAEAAWHFDETSGQLIDSTANNNDSTSTSGTTYNVDGEFNGSRDFDGTDDHIDGIPAIEPSNITIVGWINPDITHEQKFTAIYSKEESGESDFAFNLTDENTGNAVKNEPFFTAGDNNFTQTFAGISLSTDTWYQIGGRFNSSVIDVVVNGTEEVSSSWGGMNGYDGRSQYFGAFGRDTTQRLFNGQMDAFRVYSEYKSNDWMQAEYDASPKAGQVFFSQSAAETTLVEETDTATKANANSSTRTSTELNSFTDTANKASSVSTGLETVETSSAIDAVTKANGLTVTRTSTETFDTTDTVTRASAVSSSLTSTEVEVLIDNVTKANSVSSALTTNEALPITDNVSKASSVSSTITTTEVQGLVDTVVKATSTSTGLTTVEVSSATDTANKADAVSTTLMSEDQIAIIEKTVKADAVSSTVTSSETVLQQGPDVSYPLSVNEDSMTKFIKDL